MTEPRTAAGRALLDGMQCGKDSRYAEAMVLAIEAEAAQPQPSGALREALNCQLDPDGFCVIHGSEWHDGYSAATAEAAALREALKPLDRIYHATIDIHGQADGIATAGGGLSWSELKAAHIALHRAALAAAQPAEGLDVERLGPLVHREFCGGMQHEYGYGDKRAMEQIAAEYARLMAEEPTPDPYLMGHPAPDYSS